MCAHRHSAIHCTMYSSIDRNFSTLKNNIIIDVKLPYKLCLESVHGLPHKTLTVCILEVELEGGGGGGDQIIVI